MARKKYPSPPDTLDPTDWWMYCDMLQDMKAPPARWRWAKRVGDSLQAEPRLLLYAVSGAYMPRMVMHANHITIGNRHAIPPRTPFPVWVKPSQVQFLRWYPRKDDNDFLVEKQPDERLLRKLLRDAFTPDGLTTNKATLALYNYGCDYYRRLKPSTPDYGRVKLRQDFFACHGRVGVAEELDARRKWHV